MKIQTHSQPSNAQTLKVAMQPTSSSSIPQEEKKKFQEEVKFQNALMTKIKELNHKISSLQSYEKTLSLIQEEIGEIESIKSQMANNTNATDLHHRLDSLKTRLKPMLEKINNPLLGSNPTPLIEQVLKNPQKYQELLSKNQEKAQTLLKGFEEEIDGMFEQSVEFDETMLKNPLFKNAHNLATLTPNLSQLL